MVPFALTVRGLVGSEGRALRLATSLSDEGDGDSGTGAEDRTWRSYAEPSEARPVWELLVGPGGTPDQAAEATRFLADPLVQVFEGAFQLDSQLCLLHRALEAPPLETWVGRELPELVVLDVVRKVGAMLGRLQARAGSAGLPSARALHGNLAASSIYLEAGGRLRVTRFRALEDLFISEPESTAARPATGRLLAPEWGSCDEGEHTDVFCLAVVAFRLLAPPALTLRVDETLSARREVDFNASWHRLLDDRSFHVSQDVRELLAQALLHDPGMRPSARGFSDRADDCGASGEALADFALAEVPRLLRPRPGPHPWNGWRLELLPEEAAPVADVGDADPMLRRVVFLAFESPVAEADEKGGSGGVRTVGRELGPAMPAAAEEPDTIFVPVQVAAMDASVGHDDGRERRPGLEASEAGVRRRDEAGPWAEAVRNPVTDGSSPSKGDPAMEDSGTGRRFRVSLLAGLGVALLAMVLGAAWWAFAH